MVVAEATSQRKRLKLLSSSNCLKSLATAPTGGTGTASKESRFAHCICGHGVVLLTGEAPAKTFREIPAATHPLPPPGSTEESVAAYRALLLRVGPAAAPLRNLLHARPKLPALKEEQPVVESIRTAGRAKVAPAQGGLLDRLRPSVELRPLQLGEPEGVALMRRTNLARAGGREGVGPPSL